MAVLFSMEPTHAQVVGIGIKGGINFAKLSLDPILLSPVTTNKSINVAALGAIVNIKFSNLFSLQPEILYSAQGTYISTQTRLVETKFNGGTKTETFMGSTDIINLKYLQIPVLAQFAIGNERAKVFANAGPYFSYMVAASETFYYFGEKDIEIKFNLSDTDVSKNINRFDIGLSAGAGVAFKILSGEIFFEGRYNLGFIDFWKGDITNTPNYKPWQNRVLNFSAGYVYFLGKKE